MNSPKLSGNKFSPRCVCKGVSAARDARRAPLPLVPTTLTKHN